MLIEVETPFYGCQAEVSVLAARALYQQLGAAIQSEKLQSGVLSDE
ncbi:hypothetical protein [Sinimarinibacterium flocculans]|nr:hypothetical protein [Sinimarinibacterium flocculans]